MKDLVIIGAGGFAREVAWLIEENNKASNEWNILGYITGNCDQNESLNYPILGGDDWLLDYNDEINAVCCIGSSKIRESIISKYKDKKNIVFPNIISKDAIISNSVKLGKGNVICAGSILTVDITLHNFCIINLDCTVGHDAVLNDFVTLYPSVNVSGITNIGRCSELGTGTQIIQGKTIGDFSIVGAGSVVVKDIPEKCTAVGAPAKPIKFFE